MASSPTFHHEREYWQQGIAHIAGLDEVGIGALAGPVVAAAVIFPQNIRLKGIRDSKLLLPQRREALIHYIKEKALGWGIGEAPVEEISEHNIRGAAILAMKRAIAWLPITPELLLIDGNIPQKQFTLPIVSIIKGDSLCRSIAAASILAKVHRDNIMKSLDAQFPAYGFASHKGYATRQHLRVLAQHGPCLHHRPTYAPVANVLTRSTERGSGSI
jgi:ribonuclease HII